MSTSMMPSFDALPPDVRRMLTALNFNWNAEHVLVLHRQGWTAERIRQRLLQMEADKHRADAKAGGVAP